MEEQCSTVSSPKRPDDAFLERIREFRRAARDAVRADAPAGSIRLALIDLARAAEAESSRELGRWAGRAVWQECEDYLLGEPVRPYIAPEPVERACRALIARQLVMCPSCLRDLPTEDELEYWRQLRADSIVRASLLEGAVR